MYVFGSAGTCSTERFNREAFDDWRIVPNMLRDVTDRNSSVSPIIICIHPTGGQMKLIKKSRSILQITLFGKKYSSPLLIAPIGVQGIVHADAELGTARAAGSLSVPFIMSTASTRSIEDVAIANGSNNPRWYQLYWPKSPEVTISLLTRAANAGFTTLVVTLDTMNLGWRPHDLDTAYLPFTHSVGCAVGMSDPVFMGRYGLEPWPVGKHDEFTYDPEKEEKAIAEEDEEARKRKEHGYAWLGEVNSGTYKSWKDLESV